jgi:cytochrome P450
MSQDAGSEVAALPQDDHDLIDPHFHADGDLHALWARHRREAPVRWTQTPYGRGYWSLTSYERVRDVYLNPVAFSSQRNGATLPLNAQMADPEQSQTLRLAMKGAMLPQNDPPRHGIMRRAFQRHFMPKALQDLEPFVANLATDLIGEMLDKGECDFVNDVAARLPSTVIFEIMQIPREDWDFLFEMANRGSAPADPDYGNGSVLESRNQAVKAILGYIIDLAKCRRASPGDDLISVLATATVDGVPLTDEEIGYNGFMFVAAGQETTRNSLTAGIAQLIKAPDQMQRLRANPDLLQTLPDEFVRWRSPLTHVLRTATQDMELGGQRIREGDWLVAWIASANRDETVFADPFTFDIGRKPNPHLGFGAADHFCLGGLLARLQLRRIMTAFLEHVEDIELIGAIENVASHQFSGFKRMPVRVKARSRVIA